MLQVLLLLVLILPGFGEEDEKYVKLVSKNGKTIEAVILSVGESSLKVRKKNGKEYEIPFKRLADESVEAAKKEFAAKSKPEPEEKKKKPAVKTLPPIKKDAKHPKRVDLKLMSDDPRYGYTRDNPIRVGSKEEYGGPEAERAFLGSLLDAKGNQVSFKRLGSSGAGPDGNILDVYEVTIEDGSKVKLWIDMYHPDKDPKKQPAPVGFYKSK